MDLIIFTGNIGCGKSTLASKFAKKGYVVVSNDAITRMIGGDEYGIYDNKKKEIYHTAEEAIIEQSLDSNFSVVIDRTNIDKKGRERFIEIGKKYHANIVSYNWGPGNANDLRRRLKNPHGVSNDTWTNVFDHMIDTYTYPKFDEGFDECLIPPKNYKFSAFDFDGTIVELEFPKIGAIIENQVSYMRMLWEDLSNIIIVWTRRSGDYINQMKEFMLKNKIPFDFINENPLFDTGSRKIFAHEYIDDRNYRGLINAR